MAFLPLVLRELLPVSRNGLFLNLSRSRATQSPGLTIPTHSGEAGIMQSRISSLLFFCEIIINDPIISLMYAVFFSRLDENMT